MDAPDLRGDPKAEPGLMARCRHQWQLSAGVGRCAACGSLALFSAESLELVRIITWLSGRGLAGRP